MKVRKSVRTNERTIERTKERTNERTKERTNEKAISLMFLCEKKQRNMWKKSKENLRKRHFRHISGIFGRKKFFLENRTRPVLSIAKAHLWAKSEKKIMTKSQGNAKSCFFQHKKNVFRKMGSVTF